MNKVPAHAVSDASAFAKLDLTDLAGEANNTRIAQQSLPYFGISLLRPYNATIHPIVEDRQYGFIEFRIVYVGIDLGHRNSSWQHGTSLFHEGGQPFRIMCFLSGPIPFFYSARRKQEVHFTLSTFEPVAKFVNPAAALV